jgi:hypothetical protein
MHLLYKACEYWRKACQEEEKAMPRSYTAANLEHLKNSKEDKVAESRDE